MAKISSDELIRKYVFHWIDDDYILSEYSDLVCSQCDKQTFDRDINCNDCPASLEITSMKCVMRDDVTELLKALRHADLVCRSFLGSRWGDNECPD